MSPPGARVAFAGVALAHALAVLAPPLALLDGLDAPLAAAVGLAAAVVALAAASRVSEPREPLRAAAALTLLYLASVELVTAGGPGRSPGRRCSACCGRSPASAR